MGLTGNPIGRDKSQGHSSECKVDGVERKKIEEEIGQREVECFMLGATEGRGDKTA